MIFHRSIPLEKILPALKLFIKFLVAGVLIWWIVRGNGRKMLDILFPRDAQGNIVANPLWLWILGCGALIYLQVLLTSLRWRWLIPSELRPSVLTTLILTFKGMFANMFIPAGSVGGDIVKIGLFSSMLPKEKRIEAAVSVLADRIAGMAGLFSLTLFVFVLYFRAILNLAPGFRGFVFLLAGVCAAGLCAATVVFMPDLFFRFGLLKKLLDFGDRVLKGVPSETIRSVSAYRGRWKTVVSCVIFSGFLIHPCLIFAVFVPLYGILKHCPPPGAVLTAGAFGSSASVIPLTPGGIGMRDVVSRCFMTSFGVPENAAVTATLIYTAMYCLVMVCGGFCFFLPFGRDMGKSVAGKV